SLSAPPRIVHADGHQFTDVSVVSPTMMRAVSLINMNSVRALEAAVGRPVHPMRFRANIYFDGAEAWSEFDWMDKEIRIGDVPMKIIFRTRRCPATEVNPETAERDLDPPKELKAHFGHTDLGVYAEILGDGVIRPGDTISV
ncbi:MAG: MOSC domain-containing protein, partial [Pseudomonadota bacterium]